jgi:DNA-binding NtrC family response regulator
MKYTIVVLDDEASLIKWVSYALEQKGYDVFSTTEPDEALAYLKNEKVHCVISDIKMPQIDGFEFLKKVRNMYPTLPVIFITAYGSMESAIAALRDGVSDYILKPFGTEELLLRVRANLGRTRKKSEQIIGTSRPIKNVLALVDKIALTDTTVLILGESGTGKELIARQIHHSSNRSQQNFVTISCAALPETLLESELFGYKRGAFTGAISDKQGLFKTADNGTFFLDEIGDAPMTIQMKLLRLLEEKEIVPLGSTKPVSVDVRLIAATNKDLSEEVSADRFREDLYYRLNVIPIQLPPLRQRREDIAVLARYFLDAICARERLGEKKFSKSTLDRLRAYKWPGNVRELKHTVERAAILSDSYYIKPEHLGIQGDTRSQGLDELQEQEIKRVLNECGGNVTRAAAVLGVGRATLYRKIKKQDKAKQKPRSKRKKKRKK